jgi:ABC-type transport system involved in cytochrome bd biosynthesis fused ATPase/permease subunit
MRLAPGKIAAVVGPTGVGKTSLLRALLGLDTPRGGRVWWGDDELTDRGVGPSERPFAWVPQDAPVLGDTLVANVVLGGHDAAGDDEHAARVLDELGASALAVSVGDAMLATERAVSGGERQWIAVARALATRLPVLLLDEPTSSLDPGSQEKMLRAIASLRGKRTVVIVTHRTEPLDIADVVVRLDRDELHVASRSGSRSRSRSHGEHAQDRARGDAQRVGTEELAVEDVGAVAAARAVLLANAEAELEAARERIDVPGAE